MMQRYQWPSAGKSWYLPKGLQAYAAYADALSAMPVTIRITAAAGGGMKSSHFAPIALSSMFIKTLEPFTA